MVLGKSFEDVYEIEQAKLKNLADKRIRKFVLIPTMTNMGRWVWLQYAWKDYKVSFLDDGYIKKYRSYGLPTWYLTENSNE